MLLLVMTRKRNIKKTKHPISRILTPSWVSGLTAIAIALLLTGGTIIVFLQNTGSLEHQLISWQAQSTKPLTTPDETLPENDQPNLASSWPLIIFWSLVGLAVYAISTYIVHTATRTAHFNKTLQTLKKQPTNVLESLVEHMALRIVAFVTLVWLASVFVRWIIPYCILVSHASATDLASASGILYALLSMAIITVSLHLMAIFLRLSLGKTRIFT